MIWFPTEWLKAIGPETEKIRVRLDPVKKTITVTVPDAEELRAHYEEKETQWFLEKDQSGFATPTEEEKQKLSQR